MLEKYYQSREMRQFIVWSFLLLSVNFAHSQAPYLSMVEDSTEWTTMVIVTDDWPVLDTPSVQQFGHRINGDTVIDGMPYKTLSREDGAANAAWLREDLDSGYIYFRSPFEVGEKLYFDMSVNIGDSLNDLWIFDFYASEQQYLIGIDTLNFYGVDRRVYSVKYREHPIDSIFRWIEGLGPDKGIVPSQAFGIPSEYRLICSSNTDSILYQNLEPWYTCDSILIDLNTSIGSEDGSLPEILTISNTVSNGVLKFRLSNIGGQMAECRVVNLSTGIEVLRTQLTEGSHSLRLPVSAPSGIYILQVSIGNQIVSLRFVKI